MPCHLATWIWTLPGSSIVIETFDDEIWSKARKISPMWRIISSEVKLGGDSVLISPFWCYYVVVYNCSTFHPTPHFSTISALMMEIVHPNYGQTSRWPHFHPGPVARFKILMGLWNCLEGLRLWRNSEGMSVGGRCGGSPPDNCEKSALSSRIWVHSRASI